MAWEEDSFVHIPSWVFTELGLDGLDAILYCRIRGYTNKQTDGNGELKKSSYWMTLETTADDLNVGKSTIVRSLKYLMEKGYIVRYEHRHGIKPVHYYRTVCRSKIKNEHSCSQNEHIDNVVKMNTSCSQNEHQEVNNKLNIPYVDTKVSTPGIEGISEKTTEITETTEIKQPKRKNTTHTWKKNVQQEVMKRGFTEETTQLIKLWVQQLLEIGSKLPVSSIAMQLDLLLNYTNEQQIKILKKLTTKGWKHIDTTIEVMENEKRLINNEKTHEQVDIEKLDTEMEPF